MIVEGFVAYRGRDDAGVDAVHRRANGCSGRDIVLSPITHSVFPDTSSYGKGIKQSDRICVEAVQTGQNSVIDNSLRQVSWKRRLTTSSDQVTFMFLAQTMQTGPQGGPPIVPLSLGQARGLGCGKDSSFVSTPDSGKRSSAGLIGALQPESGVEPWGTAASRGLGLGLAFRGEVIASQGRPQPGHRLGNAEAAQSGGWLVLERVSGPNHTTSNIAQALGPRTDAFADLGKGEYLGCFSPEFVVAGG